MQVMDVSVAIANWNLKDLLSDCLQSIYESAEDVTFEVIVVDNGSNDGSVEMIQQHFPQIRLIRNAENLGFNVATNQAIESSRGRYVLLLNNDTVISSGLLTKLVEYMDSNPMIGIVGPKLVYPDGSLQLSCHHFKTLQNTLWMALFLYRLFPHSRIFGQYNMSYWDYGDVREVEWLMGTCMMVRRNAILEVGFLEQNELAGGADMDWCFRFWQHNWPVVFYNSAVVVHHHGKSTFAYEGERKIEWRAQSLLESFQGGCRFFKKYYGEYQLYIYVMIRKLGAALRVAILLLVSIFSRRSVFVRSQIKGQWKILKSDLSFLNSE